MKKPEKNPGMVKCEKFWYDSWEKYHNWYVKRNCVKKEEIKKTKSEKTCGGNWKVCPYAGLGSPPICKYEGYCDFQLPRDSRILVNGKIKVGTISLNTETKALK